MRQENHSLDLNGAEKRTLTRPGSNSKNRAQRNLISIVLLVLLSTWAILSKKGATTIISSTNIEAKHIYKDLSNVAEQGSLRTLDKANKLKRHVILLGPHERYNFGDLLFEKVVSKLLMTKLGYKDHEIIRAATVPMNMSVYGGYDNIVGMKQAQSMSRTSPHGPFDIIYTGGETLGCRFKGAQRMLSGDILQELASKEKIYNCAYIAPKDLLLPLNDNGEPDNAVKNIAIANSLGGYESGDTACKEAVDTADYNAYRDIAPFAPDCAVMVKELYGGLVSSTLKEVRKSLFPEDEGRKYIAVQFKETFRYHFKDLLQVFDDVARKTGCTIVFFAAGTATGHDSFELYHNMTKQMKEPAIVYEGEDVWKTVAIISGAEAVLATSLHVRIMSFIYFKPRVTWCSNDKHKHFINLWDAPNMRDCGEVATTWPLLSKYWGETPEITQEETERYYKETVSKYMESFRKWGGLLDLFNEIK